MDTNISKGIEIRSVEADPLSTRPKFKAYFNLRRTDNTIKCCVK